jgi:hypothetical protein
MPSARRRTASGDRDLQRSEDQLLRELDPDLDVETLEL